MCQQLCRSKATANLNIHKTSFMVKISNIITITIILLFTVSAYSQGPEVVIRNKDGHYLGFRKVNNVSEVWVSTTVGGYEGFSIFPPG